MITTAQEYFANLDILQNVNQPSFALLPSSENIYEIDLNSRTINAPEFLSIAQDFKAETIYFSIDRYVDYMDLADTCCIIQYNNANHEEGTRYYPVPFYDVYQLAAQKKIIFPWCIDANVTNTAGTIEFSVRFFKMGEIINERNEAEKVLAYNLGTLPATSKVLYGFKEQQLTGDEHYLRPTQYEQLIEAIDQLRNSQKLYWTILDDSFQGSSIDTLEVQKQFKEVLESSSLIE